MESGKTQRLQLTNADKIYTYFKKLIQVIIQNIEKFLKNNPMPNYNTFYNNACFRKFIQGSVLLILLSCQIAKCQQYRYNETQLWSAPAAADQGNLTQSNPSLTGNTSSKSDLSQYANMIEKPIQTNIWFADPIQDSSTSQQPNQLSSQQYSGSIQNQTYSPTSQGLSQSQSLNYSLPQLPQQINQNQAYSSSPSSSLQSQNQMGMQPYVFQNNGSMVSTQSQIPANQAPYSLPAVLPVSRDASSNNSLSSLTSNMSKQSQQSQNQGPSNISQLRQQNV